MDLIYYYLPALETIRDFLELGGNVLFVIGLLTLFMWALIIERIVYIRIGHRRIVLAYDKVVGYQFSFPAGLSQQVGTHRNTR